MGDIDLQTNIYINLVSRDGNLTGKAYYYWMWFEFVP